MDGRFSERSGWLARKALPSLLLFVDMAKLLLPLSLWGLEIVLGRVPLKYFSLGGSILDILKSNLVPSGIIVCILLSYSAILYLSLFIDFGKSKNSVVGSINF